MWSNSHQGNLLSRMGGYQLILVRELRSPHAEGKPSLRATVKDHKCHNEDLTQPKYINKKQLFKITHVERYSQEFPVVQWLRICTFTLEGN